MSQTQTVKQLAAMEPVVAYRPSQVYTVAAPGPAYTIFSVSGGPIEALRLIGFITAAAVGATTIAGTLNTVAGDAGAVACNGAVGTCVWYPMNVAATILNAVAFPATIATNPSAMIVGLTPTLTPGLIVMTYAIGTSLTMSWSLVYRKLTPSSIVLVP